jgi:hypothetical protein
LKVVRNESGKTVMYAEHLKSTKRSAPDHRANRRVHTWGIAAAGQNSNSPKMGWCHIGIVSSPTWINSALIAIHLAFLATRNAQPSASTAKRSNEAPGKFSHGYHFM